VQSILKVQIQSFFQYADFREHLVLSRKAQAARRLELFQFSSWPARSKSVTRFSGEVEKRPPPKFSPTG
jgi:hypothetical protein